MLLGTFSPQTIGQPMRRARVVVDSVCTLISHAEDSHPLWTATCVSWAVRSLDKEVGESVKLMIAL